MAEAIVARARGLIGTRFRPQGRSMRDGLDCIGVAALAFDLPIARVPVDYRLRGGRRERIEREIDRHLMRVRGAGEAGDLLLVEAGPGQFHAIVLTPAGYVHADAGLRRVVEAPGPPRWPILSAWRLADQEGE